MITTRFQLLFWPKLRCLILENCLAIDSFPCFLYEGKKAHFLRLLATEGIFSVLRFLVRTTCRLL
jgi:hypothetical protein